MSTGFAIGAKVCAHVTLPSETEMLEFPGTYWAAYIVVFVNDCLASAAQSLSKDETTNSTAPTSSMNIV
jgi:hypothetical protein